MAVCLAAVILGASGLRHVGAQTALSYRTLAASESRLPVSRDYRLLQRRLAQGWNTWDVNSVTTHVRLPEGLSIQIGLQHNAGRSGDAFLSHALIGRITPDAELVTPGPHSWNGSYTDIRVSWKGHSWRVQSARIGEDLVLLALPLPAQPISALPPTIVFSVNFLWNRQGTTIRRSSYIDARWAAGSTRVYCTCAEPGSRRNGTEPESASDENVSLPIGGPYFAADFTLPVGISTGKRRNLAAIQAIVAQQREAYERSIREAGKAGPTVDAIQTSLGWNTIYDPEGKRVITPVSRVWSIDRGGFVLFDWDSFFASTMAAIGDRGLAYANAMETLRGATPRGFVPNYSRPGGWKTFDRSEPPVGAITVLALYRQYGDRWFLEDTFQPLLKWNEWWAKSRDIQGYLTWGSDADTNPSNPDDVNRGTRVGAILESGLDNSPMYDDATFNPATHRMDFADVGLMSLYIADCDALATIADTLGKPAQAAELCARSLRYKNKLQSMWDEQTGMFLNRDLRRNKPVGRLSPTNFYPLLARAATPKQAERMVREHLVNPKEFWGEWVLPTIARDDPAFADQDYWRGRIWGPTNYLVYLGLRNYGFAAVRKEFAAKSNDLFLKEWRANGHVHENYNAITGAGDDGPRSDPFYHWGALLGYIDDLEQNGGTASVSAGN
jgi:hypothetical protein